VCIIFQVGKNSFRPPPKVDSSVIRIEPRVPPPPLNFNEWDSLTRIAFSRKNKTLLANFKTSAVRNSLVRNYASTNSKQLTQIKKNAGSTNSLDFKEVEKVVSDKIDNILEVTSYGQKRARALDVDDFIKLLVEFNKEGIHFA